MRRRALLGVWVSAVIGAAAACGSSHDATSPARGSDAGFAWEAGITLADAGADAGWTERDGGFVVDGGVLIRADRFVTKVVSFLPGDCGGFGIPQMPGVVMGPPVGGGAEQGSLDVVSLGNGGEIVLSFEPNAIVDGPGVDFIVFENAFYAGGDPQSVFAEPGEVSVSEDGVTWKTFPCTATQPPFGACAGWHPVFSNPDNGLSPIDPKVAGGDLFDLADVGMTHARFVRIRDKSNETCRSGPSRANTNGFDLDAIAIVNAELK